MQIRRRYSRFTFAEETIGNSPKVPRDRFLGSNGLFCFISIFKFGSFKNLFEAITSLPELYFRFRKFIHLIKRKAISIRNRSWQQHRQLKTMEMGEASPDTFDEGYIYQFQPESTHKIHEQQQKHWVLRYPSMEHLPNDHEDRPNQHGNSHKQCDETGHLVVNMMERQWKLRQEHNEKMTVWDRKNITEFARSISSTIIGKPVLMTDVMDGLRFIQVSRCG